MSKFIKPAMAVSLNSASSDLWSRNLLEISCQSSLAPEVDQARLIIANDDPAPAFALADKGKLQLGYAEDQLKTVFSGGLVRIQTIIDRKTVLTLCNGAFILSQLRINQSFEQMSAGDIVQDLSAQAGIETDTIESGINFPFYVIDDAKNLYQHIAILADKSGLIAFFTPENKLAFTAPTSGRALRTFHYGADLISINLIHFVPVTDQITIVGAGAAGVEGSDAWSWLIKDPQSITATEGSGDRKKRVSDAGLRNAEAVQKAAAGKLFFSRKQASKAKMTVLGAPELSAGNKLEITGAPQAMLNGTALIESAIHQYSKHQGFITELQVAMETGAQSTLGGSL